MIKVLLVLLYLWKGEVKLETKQFESMEECVKSGNVYAQSLAKDPRFEDGLYADCIPLVPGQKVYNKAGRKMVKRPYIY